MAKKKVETEMNKAEVLKTMSSATWRYKKILSSDELHSCKLMGLWKTLREKTPEDKYLGFLFKRVQWECAGLIKEKTSSVTYVNDDVLDSYTDYKTGLIEFMLDAPKDYRILIEQRFIEKMTFSEIGHSNGYSHETARRKLREAVDYVAGINSI